MALPLDPGYWYELVRGKIKVMSYAGEEHSLVGSNLSFALEQYIRPRKLGRVLQPSRFQLDILGESKASLRIPDLTFLEKEKVTGQPGAVQFVPDLAVEVYSTHDRPSDYATKFADFQAAGWNIVWLIYPPESSPQYKAGTAEIYHLQESLEPVRTMQANEELVGEGVLEGFRLPLTDLFNYGV